MEPASIAFQLGSRGAEDRDVHLAELPGDVPEVHAVAVRLENLSDHARRDVRGEVADQDLRLAARGKGVAILGVAETRRGATPPLAAERLERGRGRGGGGLYSWGAHRHSPPPPRRRREPPTPSARRLRARASGTRGHLRHRRRRPTRTRARAGAPGSIRRPCRASRRDASNAAAARGGEDPSVARAPPRVTPAPAPRPRAGLRFADRRTNRRPGAR